MLIWVNGSLMWRNGNGGNQERMSNPLCEMVNWKVVCLESRSNEIGLYLINSICLVTFSLHTTRTARSMLIANFIWANVRPFGPTTIGLLPFRLQFIHHVDLWHEERRISAQCTEQDFSWIESVMPSMVVIFHICCSRRAEVIKFVLHKTFYDSELDWVDDAIRWCVNRETKQGDWHEQKKKHNWKLVSQMKLAIEMLKSSKRIWAISWGQRVWVSITFFAAEKVESFVEMKVKSCRFQQSNIYFHSCGLLTLSCWVQSTNCGWKNNFSNSNFEFKCKQPKTNRDQHNSASYCSQARRPILNVR